MAVRVRSRPDKWVLVRPTAVATCTTDIHLIEMVALPAASGPDEPTAQP